MFDLSTTEVAAIHAKIDAEIEESGIPSDEALMAEIEAMNQTTSRKTVVEQALGV